MTRARDEQDRPVGRPISRLRLKAVASVLLVRVEPHEECGGLGLDELGVRVLRVRHPLPACERIRVVRPLAVLVGPRVRDEDVDGLQDAAGEVGSELVEIGAFVSASALREVVRRAVLRARKRRGAGAYDDVPAAKRATSG